MSTAAKIDGFAEWLRRHGTPDDNASFSRSIVEGFLIAAGRGPVRSSHIQSSVSLAREVGMADVSKVERLGALFLQFETAQASQKGIADALAEDANADHSGGTPIVLDARVGDIPPEPREGDSPPLELADDRADPAPATSASLQISFRDAPARTRGSAAAPASISASSAASISASSAASTSASSAASTSASSAASTSASSAASTSASSAASTSASSAASTPASLSASTPASLSASTPASSAASTAASFSASTAASSASSSLAPETREGEHSEAASIQRSSEAALADPVPAPRSARSRRTAVIAISVVAAVVAVGAIVTRGSGDEEQVAATPTRATAQPAVQLRHVALTARLPAGWREASDAELAEAPAHDPTGSGTLVFRGGSARAPEHGMYLAALPRTAALAEQPPSTTALQEVASAAERGVAASLQANGASYAPGGCATVTIAGRQAGVCRGSTAHSGATGVVQTFVWPSGERIIVAVFSAKPTVSDPRGEAESVISSIAP